jgi:hypothetical protein
MPMIVTTIMISTRVKPFRTRAVETVFIVVCLSRSAD